MKKLLILTFLFIVFPVAWGQVQLHFYVYGSSGCGACLAFKDFLKLTYGVGSIYFYDLDGSERNQAYFEAIYEAIAPETNRYYPLTGVLINDRLVAVVIGYEGKGFWDDLLLNPPIQGEIYFYNLFESQKPKILKDKEIIDMLKGLFRQSKPLEEIKKTRSNLEILPLIFFSAAADSVNPCTFSVFATMLLLASVVVSRRKLLFIGLTFIAAVFTVYLLIGLGLLKVLGYIPFLKYIVGLLAVILGLNSLRNYLIGKHRPPIPDSISRAISQRLGKAVNPFSSFLIGVFTSLTLLPCTSGPYLVALTIVSGLNSFLKLLFLLFYNSVFILPLIAILLGVYTYSIKKGELRHWKREKLVLLDLIEGVILVALGLYVLFSPPF